MTNSHLLSQNKFFKIRLVWVLSGYEYPALTSLVMAPILIRLFKAFVAIKNLTFNQLSFWKFESPYPSDPILCG